MNCTFYRPKNTNIIEYENIIGKLYYDLYLLETQPSDEWNVYTYIYELSKLAKPLENNSKMRFLGLGNPKEMPSDARVEFFYQPTYVATAFIMKAVLLYPSLLDEKTFLDSDLEFYVDTVKETISSLMLACTGREFSGAGVLKLEDCIKLFTNAGAVEFIEKYSNLCPEFNGLFLEKKKMVDSGETDPRESWYF